ncbi:MAG: DUF2520 domain-containing protein [Alistipes sp.]|nr:DUF2520 domain-containing protein [Alistipes sp.]
MDSITIVGSGNVAEAMALAVAECWSLNLKQIVARNAERGRALAALTGAEWCDDIGNAAEADLYIICVSDRAVAQVASQLPAYPNAIVAHTAGSVEMEAIGTRRCGVFYPFQTFTAGLRVDFSQVPLFIEGSDEATTEALESVAEQLSCRVYRLSSERRREIHLTGVLACNFVNALYAMAADRLAEYADLPFDVVRPLIEQTARKAIEADHPRSVQTGPAVRGDKQVEARHLAMLEGDERKQQIYKLLTDYIWETSRKI